MAGWAIFAAGLIFETVADIQKTRFRNNPDNKGRFICTGEDCEKCEEGEDCEECEECEELVLYGCN